MKIHHLGGCAPVPLAHYLKALGVLRIVSEQLDPEARGWWEGERFVLATVADERELVEFFLGRYAPTALVAPWNKGSGFFQANDPGLMPIERSTAPRFERLRQGVRAAREQLDALGAADRRVREIKDETKRKGITKAQREALKGSEDYKKRLAEADRLFKRLKADLMPNLRLDWRGSHREWMDAALVLEDDGAARFPSLLGTGGNDGRLDFTNNYFQRLNQVYDVEHPEGAARKESKPWIAHALFGTPARITGGFPVGQFDPGGAGGANATAGPDGPSRMNPVDFVLMLEGTILFTAAASKRMEASRPARAAAPFALPGDPTGYASASSSEAGARGEQWMPLWQRPLGLPELRRLLSEGRCQLGARGAKEPLELARAVTRLGTARGIGSFERFGYIERNGQSNLAVPLGRFVVPEQPATQLACLDDLETWLPRLKRQARDQKAPVRLAQAERRLGDALFGIVQHSDEPRRWQTVLLALADIEAIQVTGSGYQAGPIPRLRPEWIGVADDGSAEVRLAVAFALQAEEFDVSGRPVTGTGVRRHWLTLKGARYSTTGVGGQTRLFHETDRVFQGRNGVEDAIALVTRRLVESSKKGDRMLSLRPARRAHASVVDLAALVEGRVDLDRTIALGRALLAVDSRRWGTSKTRVTRPRASDVPDDGWLAIRLAHLPWPLPDGRRIPTNPSIIRRLEGGDAAGAVALALRALRAAGIGATVRTAGASPSVARLWAAALAFPISRETSNLFLRRLDPQAFEETAA